MFHHLLSIILILIGTAHVSFAGSSGAISILHPKTGEWCLVGLDHVGPKELSLNETGTFRIRLQNRSSCTLKYLEFIDKLPNNTSFIRAQPEPSRVKKQKKQRGPILSWTGLRFNPGDVQVFDLEIKAGGKPDRMLKNRLCLAMPRYAEEEYCYYFEIKVRP